MDVKAFNIDTKLIAHRGLSSMAVENTLEAFILAAKLPFYGIETDLHVTKDNVFVMHHDDNTKRITNVDLMIKDTNYQELTKLDVNIPTLEAYLLVCKTYNKIAILELKAKLNITQIKEVITKIKQLDYLENVIFISFIVENLDIVRSILPKQSLQLLVGEIDENIMNIAKKQQFDINCYYGNLTKEKVAMIHEQGLKVNCFTVDDKVVIDQLISMGVDFITTNGIK